MISGFGKDDFVYLTYSEDFQKKNFSCIRLKDLHEYVNKKLNEFGNNFNNELHANIEGKIEIYDRKLEEIKNNIKDAAVKQFGMTMYDVLSLQDDYYHFEKELEAINISEMLTSLEENTAQIKLMLISLKKGMEIYRNYCLNCNGRQRKRRGKFKFEITAFEIHCLDINNYAYRYTR